MDKIEITKQRVEAAYEIADESTKRMLIKLFGEKAVKPEKPDYSDYRNIKSYEDACKALSIAPVGIYEDDDPDEIAYRKLKIISKALWGTFEPKPNASGNDAYWYPWFALYTRQEIKSMNDEDRGALLSAHAYGGTLAGFGYLVTNYRSSYAGASIGFRLCQETQEKARYFGRQFTKLWADYLLMNVDVKDEYVE